MILPVVGCLFEEDERDDSEVVFEPSARQPPCWDASECLFNRKPSRAVGEFLYQSGTFSRCRDLCTLNSCSLGTRSPTFCSSFSGGCNNTYTRIHIYVNIKKEEKITIQNRYGVVSIYHPLYKFGLTSKVLFIKSSHIDIDFSYHIHKIVFESYYHYICNWL